MKRALIPGIIGAVGLAVILLADRHFRAESTAINEITLRHALMRAADHLADHARNRINAVEGLASFMQVSETLPENDRFDQFAAKLLNNHKTIRGFALVDARGIIRHFYPKRGNEAAIGLDLMQRPAAPFVTAAIRERRTTVNHPTQTVQDSLSVIARTPFYRNEKLAGLVQGVFDISSVVAEATVDLNPHVGFMLHDAVGNHFFGAERLFGNLQSTMIPVGDNRWALVAGWKDGTPGPAPALLGLLWGGGSLLLLSLMLLVGRGMAREQELQTAVAERTRTLHESESRLNEVQRLAHIGSWELDLTTNHLVWSKGIYSIFEIDPERFSPSYETFLDKVHPEDRETVNRVYTESVKNRTPYDIVHRLLMKDGRVKYVHERCETLYDDQGRPLRSLGTAQDITERKRAEDNLLEIARGVSATTGESFFHSLVAHLARMLNADYAFIGELVAGADDRIHSVAVHAHGQPAANFDYELSGTPCQNVVGKETCAYPSEVAKQFPDDRMLVEMGAEAYVGTPLFGATGQALGLLVVLYRRPIQNEATVGSTLEIFAARAAAELERARAEAALRENEARLRAVVSNAPVVLFTLDRNGVIQLSEGRGLAGLQLRPGEANGRSIFELYHDYPEIIAAIRRALAGEVFVNIATLGPLTFEVHYSPTFGADGRVETVIGLAVDISERKRAEDALIQSETNFRVLTENANVGILVNHRGKHVFANPRLLAMLGYSAGEIGQTGIQELVHPDEYEKVMQRFRDRQAGKPVAGSYETVFVTRQGKPLPVELTAAMTTWQGEPAGLVFLHDITVRILAQEQMRKLSGAVEQTADLVMITDHQGVIEYVNPAFERSTGYSRAEAVGGTPRLLKSDKQGQAFYEQLWRTILAGEVFSDVLINRKKDGSLYYEEKTISPLKDGAGRITHFVATGKDVSERMQAQERLQHMAQHDALTELPNRMLFLDRLQQALARARWHERLVAVLFIDLDRFKNINDSLGHEAGDRLLQALAERFTRSVRDGDTVARFGGDEFVILLDDVGSEKDIGAVAQKVLDAIAPSFSIDGQNLYITASIGVSLFPNDGEDPGTLLKHADIAMYRAKEMGKNTYQFYSADMSARAFERLTLESSLRHAIERQEFRLYFQPQIDIVSGQIVGVEALLRWQHPDFGLVTPAEFIPLLEETGLIVPAGEWVFHTACTRLREWHAAGWPSLRLAVNLSPRQFQVPGLATMIERGLSRVGCDPGLIELEITEGVLLRHAGATLDTLAALRTLGVRLAIDDFGTGYSSLSYLRRYSIDTLKIDRSFVHDVPEDPDDSAITAAIISLSRSLMLEVIAEGVETEAQRDFLRSHGCRVMQGYLFSRPLPAGEIAALLAAAPARSE